MQKKVYPQSFKDEVVKFYSTNHMIAETIEKYRIAESTLFEWRKRYDERHYHLFLNQQFINHFEIVLL